jgi:HK97 family phage major capsid protein
MSYAKLLREKRAALQTELDELANIEARDLTPEREERATALIAELGDYDARIKDAVEVEERAAASNAAAVAAGEGGKEERVGGAKVTREERTYTKEKSERGEASFFADSFNLRENTDLGARDRLERHAREVIVEGEISKRATTTSSFAGLIVPQYLVDQAALIARSGRPFADTVQKLQLPDQGTQFQIPQGTTGAATAIQATENASVQSTDEVWANVTVNVSTIAGQQDVSRQSLERGTPGLDALVYLDLAGAYAANLDSQVLTGSGGSGQLLGVQNTSSINAATAFGAAVTATNFFTKVAGQVQAVAANRFMAADSIVMHPRRWGWYLSQIASDGRPLAVPNNNGPTNSQAVYSSGQPYGTVVGALQGLPVITDASIPTTAGTINEDLVFVYRSADLLLWEDGDGMPRQLRFEQTLGNQLTVKLVVYGYAAFTAGRYPKAVGKIGGLDTTTNGLIAPTF